MTAAESVDVAGMSRVDRSLVAVARRRIDGMFELDAWGLDADLVSVLGRVVPNVGIRTSGAGRIPDGPALLLWRGGVFGWVHVVRAIGAATGRAVRFTGVPDVAPISGVLHRVGGVGGNIADLRGLLRSGNLVALRLDTGQALLEEPLAGMGWTGEDHPSLVDPLSADPLSADPTLADGASPSRHPAAAAMPTPQSGADSGRPGSVDWDVDDWLPDDEVAAASRVGVPVVPVRVQGPRPWSPWAEVVVGEPVPTRTRRAVRSLAEVSAAVAASFAAIE
jgi:hypothetical protein